MIGDTTSIGNSSSSAAKVIISDVNNNSNTAQSENLAKQSETIANLLEDTVEISDDARALADTAKAVSKYFVASEEIQPPKNNTVSKPLATAEERAQAGDDYNAILQELRSEYGDEEGMRRFDKFMISQGFERRRPVNC